MWYTVYLQQIYLTTIFTSVVIALVTVNTVEAGGCVYLML